MTHTVRFHGHTDTACTAEPHMHRTGYVSGTYADRYVATHPAPTGRVFVVRTDTYDPATGVTADDYATLDVWCEPAAVNDVDARMLASGYRKQECAEHGTWIYHKPTDPDSPTDGWCEGCIVDAFGGDDEDDDDETMRVEAGMLVKMRDDFSEHVRGIVFVVDSEPMSDNTTTPPTEYVWLRMLDDPKRTRSARLSDLRPVDDEAVR